MLVLSGGITYLALNQPTKGNVDEDISKMTVALVNEDQGALLNEAEIDFGKEFVKSIEKDNTHDWYVVSRGVAESGLENNAYNMMIVIPNDFSERALSIEAEAPERILLNYKINTSGSAELKAEAEKTASGILNDFNRRIIDVYFASIIGNLQEAQDKISSIVEKETIYTNTYKNAIQNPLSQYTAQFDAVQDNTQHSREGFEGLQEILSMFETNLVNGLKPKEDYLTSLADIAKMHEVNTVSFENFSNHLSVFSNGMSDNELLNQLRELELANKAIYEQFQKQAEGSAPTIVSEAKVIQQYLIETYQKLESFNGDIAKTLANDLEGNVTDRIQKAFEEIFREERGNLESFLVQADNDYRKRIKNQVEELPPINLSELQEFGLSKQTINELKNVTTLTKEYEDEFGFTFDNKDGESPLTKKIQQIKYGLIETGVEVTDTVRIPATKKRGQEFKLLKPANYNVASVHIKLPGKTERNYTRSYYRNGTIILPKNEEGEFGVRVVFKLDAKENEVDILQPISWSWELRQTDEGGIAIPDPEPAPQPDPEVDPEPSPEPVPESELPEEIDAQDEQPFETINLTADEQPEQENIEQDEIEETPMENDEEEEPGIEENEIEIPAVIPDPTPGPMPKPEKVTVTKHMISSKVSSSLTTDATGKLASAAIDTVKEYRELMTLYETYFGVDMKVNHSEFVKQLEGTTDDFATDSSLYKLFNKDIVQLFTDYVVGNITGTINEQVHEQVEGLQRQMLEYTALVKETNDESDDLIQIIGQTSNQASTMNANIESLLGELAQWREKSIELLEEQEGISLGKGDEQVALVSLDGQFNSLLVASQSLAEQAKGNLSSADYVYESFDAIDNQARIIQEGGTTLVNDANTLATNLTEKLIEDQNFANNFAGVLENSRIGERPNENLYSFLSNPVQTKNAGVISAGDTLTPYFLVLISFIVALFTGYALSTNDRIRVQRGAFEEESTLMGMNTPITLLTLGIGLVEGMIIGIVSGKLLQIDPAKLLLWIALITLITLTMILITTYLLRQLKMIGMFVLLTLLGLYLFSTEALGTDFDKLSLAATIRKYSPLQYVESLLTSVVNGIPNNQGMIFILIGLALIAVVANLLVIHRSLWKEGIADEAATETR